MRKVNLQKIVENGVRKGVKSIFLFPGLAPLGNTAKVIKLDNAELEEKDVHEILKMSTSEWQYERFQQEKELDYSYSLSKASRFRVNAFVRMGQPALVIRPIPASVPPFDSLGVPERVKDFTKENTGLVLVTGTTGSGKSTTMASLIEIINRQRVCHIVTIEDPIEFFFVPQKSIISQREVGKDTKSFHEAIKRILREDVDVILVGEIRDRETMKVVLEMAETGHLVFSTLHTMNVVQTVDRVLDFFQDEGRSQIQVLLSQHLKGVVSQRLIQKSDGDGFACACEVMVNTRAIANLIKDNKISQLYSVIELSKAEGMVSMNTSLMQLYDKGLIDMTELITYSYKEKGFLEKITDTTPKARPALSGYKRLDLAQDMILYTNEFTAMGLRHLDASGFIMSTPMGLIFRDKGYSGGGYNFIIDYTILNDQRKRVAMKSLFSVDYQVLDVKNEKKFYYFRLRVTTDNNEHIELPKAPVELDADGEVHTLVVPFPKIYMGKSIKYYAMLFDSDIREMVYNKAMFV